MQPPAPPKEKLKSRCEAKGIISSPSDIDKVIDFLQSKPTQHQQLDGIDHLFLSYADTFKKFQPTTQAMLKIELATLFARTEVKELGAQVVTPASSAMQSDNSSSSMSTTEYETQSCTPPIDHEHSMEPSSTNLTFVSVRDIYENASNLLNYSDL